MGASLSTPAAPTVRAEAMMAAPPQGCPMHQEAQPVKGTAARGMRMLLIMLLTTLISLYCAMWYHF